jgi:hypothetical protein
MKTRNTKDIMNLLDETNKKLEEMLSKKNASDKGKKTTENSPKDNQDK